MVLLPRLKITLQGMAHDATVMVERFGTTQCHSKQDRHTRSNSLTIAGVGTRLEEQNIDEGEIQAIMAAFTHDKRGIPWMSFLGEGTQQTPNAAMTPSEASNNKPV